MIEKSIYHGVNLLDFARELVPITMYSDVFLLPTDDDEISRKYNPLFSGIQYSIWTNKSPIKRNRDVSLSIKNCAHICEEAVKVIESEPPPNKKR